MKMRMMVLVLTSSLSIFQGSKSYGNDVYLIVPGATAQEMSELNSVTHSGERNAASYDQILKQYPNNRPALLMCANYLLRSGQLLSATADLGRLKELAPDFPGLNGFLVEVYRSGCNDQEEVASLERSVKAPDSSSDAKLTDARNARILELHGDIPGALRTWKAAIEKADPQLTVLFQVDAADFMLRHGMVGEAIDELKKVTQSDSVNASDKQMAQVHLGIAYWVGGRRKDAIQAFGTAIHHFAEDPGPDPELEALCALSLFSLSNTDSTVASNQPVNDALKRAVHRFNGEPNTMGPTLLLLMGQPDANLVDRVRTVLKAAPGLEWAQWSALFLAANHVKGAETLVPVLPDASVPKKLAHVEKLD